MKKPTTYSVLRHLDIDALRTATRLESRARQHYLPPISVYRWWARRTEAVSGAIVEAVNVDRPGRLLLADPFAGGGVIAMAALIRGHRVYAQDVNSWAARSLVTMLDLPAPDELGGAADRLHAVVEQLLDEAYATTLDDGEAGQVSHTLRVATAPCPSCENTLRLFPSALVSLTDRVDCGGDTGYLACPAGHLYLGPATKRSSCSTCGRYVKPTTRYTTGRMVRCVECGWVGKISALAGTGGFAWEVLLVERVGASAREIGPPNVTEVEAADCSLWAPARRLGAIKDGVETRVLLRHGMRRWNDLYPARQRVVLESLLAGCRSVAKKDAHVRRALEAAVIGSAEMAGFTSRWDARYLKAYEAVANHRFSFTTLAVEPNVWGVESYGRGTVARRIDLITKAGTWLEERVGRPLQVEGPIPAAARRTPIGKDYDARVVLGSSERLCVPAGSLDAVVTDPPYHDDVHYAELSDLFRAWAGGGTGAIEGDAVVHRGEMERATEDYCKRLVKVFTEVRRALCADGHLVLSFANREPRAWAALFAALQSAGFRTVGFEVVHSENETDHAKAGRRACNLDVLIDLVATDRRVHRHRPLARPKSDEEKFCRVVGAYALEIGSLCGGWRDDLLRELNASAFLRKS